MKQSLPPPLLLNSIKNNVISIKDDKTGLSQGAYGDNLSLSHFPSLINNKFGHAIGLDDLARILCDQESQDSRPNVVGVGHLMGVLLQSMRLSLIKICG